MMTHRVITIRSIKNRAGLVKVLLLPVLVLFVTPVFALKHGGCDINDVHDQKNCRHSAPHAVMPIIADGYGNFPLVFEANQGQLDPDIKFMTRGKGYNLYLAASNVTAMLYQSSIQSGKESLQDPLVQRLRINFPGANPDAQITGGDQLPGSSNYFVSNDPHNWFSGIKQYKNAKYENIYPDIDLVFYGNQDKIEYDFIIKPGASHKAIMLDYQGAEGISIDEDGNLILHNRMGDLIQHTPYAYQVVNGNEVRVNASYVLQSKNKIGFRVGAYDTSQTLIIDPVLAYSTYLGGSLADTVTGITVDDSGNAYITGYTLSTDYNTVSALNSSTSGGVDIFVSKINADGSSLAYSTYLGGSGDDWGYGIAVDSTGAVAVTGTTASADFPTVAAIQSSYGGSSDAFVTKLNSAGSAIVYSTYIGGAGNDEARAITFNVNGEVYTTGSTSSSDFPVNSGFQMTKSSAVDAYISKINAAGSAFIYSSYLGGSNGNGDDFGYAIAADDNDNAYVTGKTAATTFPTVSPLQQTYGGGASDIFVAKIHPLGSSVLYATYLGGSGNEVANGIGVDSNENIYITGSTTSANFPVVYSSYDSACGTDGSCDGNNYDAFVAKITTDGSALSYSTYIGGSADDFATAIAVSAAGSAYISGYTGSANFPSKSAIQPLHGGVNDAFIVRLNTNGTALDYSTFLGGSGGDTASGLDIDASGNVYVTGNTVSMDFPTSSPLQASLSGSTDIFVAKISAVTDLWVTMVDSIDPVDANSDFSYTVIVTNNGPDTASNTTLTDILPAGMSFVSATSTQGTCSGVSTIACNIGVLAGGESAIVTMDVTASQTITNSVNVTSGESDPDTSNNIDSEQTVITASSQVVGVSSSGGGGGSDYGLFVMLMVYITFGAILKMRIIAQSAYLR